VLILLILLIEQAWPAAFSFDDCFMI